MLKVTVILCFCYLIKDVLPSTTGFGIKNNKKLRLCISKELKTDEIKNNCLVLGLEDSGVECVDGHNQLECLRQINNGSADFGVFNPEDLVAAQADDDATVIAEIRTSDRSFQRYVVAVVDHTVLVDRPGRLHAVLKGRVLCHPGTDVGQRSAYTKTLNGYLEFLVQQPSECSSDENRIKTLADYFGRSCKAGPWVPDRFRDSELKRQYSSLCAACGSGTCSAKDRYWGALGALACVVEVGEVAWAEMSQVESFFTGSFFGLLSNRDGPYLTPESFALLCPDYSSQAITNATESCVWLHQPWPAIVARGTKLLSVEKLTRTMASAETTSGFWRSALQVVLGVASATLTPLEYPITAVDYLSRARGFRDAYSVKPCEEKPKKTFKCRNGVVIPQYKVCDGTKDCPKGDDETFRTCRRNACAEDMFRCAYGGCLDADVECNGKVDCPDGSDEFEDLCEIINDSTTEKPSPDKDILPPTNIPTRPPRPHTRPPPPPTRPTTTTESNDKLCVLPPYPEHGTYVVTNRPDAVPGQAFDSVHYTVTCSKGYTIIRGKTERICFQGIWSDEIRSCERFCNLPKDPSIDYLCPTSKNPLDDSDNRICDTQEPEGTIVIPACKAPNYYFPGELRYMRCIGGLWDYAAKCYPECGYLSQPEDQLVFGGRKAERGELPWNTVVYSKKNGMYKQICGGSLVTTKAVVSAAHCFWDEVSHSLHPPANYAVAFGKIDRDYNSTKEEGVVHVQRSDVSEIHVPERYRGSLSNFADDLSVIIIEKPVVLNLFIRPVCIDFSILFEERQLREGSVGKIATWGQTKYEGDFKVLRVLKLPYIPIGDCLADSPNGFIEYISGDKFCAGYRNGSAICKGDSGGGLVFPETDRGRTRYYLRGVASTAPANANYCDQSWLTTFTQLSKHEKFLKKYISNVNGPPLPNSIFSGTQL